MKEPVPCPNCGTDLRVLLFMGIQPDGYICDECRVWFDDRELRPLATIIMAKKEEEHFAKLNFRRGAS